MTGSDPDPADAEPAASPLHAAMKMADLVRSSLQQRDDDNNDNEQADHFRLTPGILEGTGAAVATLLVLAPVRSAVLRAAGPRLGLLPDLVVTTSQILLASNAGLYYGSLYGSYHYLHTFTHIPVDAVSPTVDGICRQSQGSVVRTSRQGHDPGT